MSKPTFSEMLKTMSLTEIIALANKGYFDDNHPYTTVVHKSRSVNIDNDILPLIQKIWNLGVDTCFSCQGTPNSIENSYISFPYKDDIIKLFTMFPYFLNER